ncbi:MAG TPA: glycosyltransferase family 39 protein [Candidatus Sulfopaludibacter sp.]|nr:glycosyltransferase family 39 protein [Candidatus Sulfopaludibacter sp.]
MHWLQTLDVALFHFINGSLSNPFFDRLMPIMSGGGGVMRWFVLVVLAAVAGALCFGNARARLCALMVALVITLGDPLVVNTIKHAVHRPRPFVTLPDARVFGVVGQGYVPPEEMTANTGSRNSLPSAHAANWFAATMVLFLFYRRSVWFMLPMALAVSFSRVYNGVHYPSDVLAGMILGAGYAAAGVVAAQTIWNWAGRKWFPLWHAQMPSLLRPVHRPPSTVRGLESGAAESEIENRKSEIQWLRLGYLLTFVLLVAGWVYLASGTLQLSQDEAYQWVWSKHLALSYYSKPPGIALIQFAGTALFGDNEFGVRFFSPLFAAILSVMLLRFFTREISARAGFWLLLIILATPLLALGTVLMTIDPPLVLCWTWAMIAGWRAVQPDAQTRLWVAVGLATGLGFLCKYSVLYQLVCWALFFALWRPARAQLRKPGPWLALLILLVCTLPVIIWNWQHGWITVRHVANDAGLQSQWHPTLRYFWDFTFQELALLNPIFLIGALLAMIGFWKFRRERPLSLYLFCMGTPVFLGHWLFSFHSRVLPNWIAPAVIPMFCLMIVYWDERRRLAKLFLTIGLALGFFAFAILHQSKLIGKIAGEMLPGSKDPTRRVQAWKQEAALVESEREKLQQVGKPAFIICSHYGITGLYSFYIPQAKAAVQSDEPLVYAMDSDTPYNQFYFWPEYDYRENRRGQNAIFVSEVDPYPLEPGWFWKWLEHGQVNYGKIPPPSPAPEKLLQQFGSVSDLGEHDVTVGGRVFHRVHLWACYHLK